MRDKINVFYYPEMVADHATLKKAILLFDEIHFMDRPSFTFGNFGTIGMASPLWQFEASFTSEGVRLFVHGAPGGPVARDLYETVSGDANDPLFLSRFQEGLRSSQTFRDLQIAHGDYGASGTHEDVGQKVTSVDLEAAIGGHKSAMALFADESVRHFDLATPTGCAKQLITGAVVCSTKINFALSVSSKNGFVPLADAAPYAGLLGAKYARAMKNLPAKTPVQVTDLSFAIFDELVPLEQLARLTFEEVIRYRRASEAAREEFLERLSVIQIKQASIGAEGNYAGAIRQMIKTEIIPSARTFKSKLQTIHESLYGALAKGTIIAAGGSAAINFFGDLSWERLLALAGPVGAYVGKAAIDAFLAQRAARRECSISYILSLNE